MARQGAERQGRKRRRPVSRPALANFNSCSTSGKKCSTSVGSEMLPRPDWMSAQACLAGQACGALAGEGVKHIGNRHDACCQRNGPPDQALGVATAVSIFVVAQRHFMRQKPTTPPLCVPMISAADFRVAAHRPIPRA